MELRESKELRDQLSDLRIAPLTQDVNEMLEFEEKFPSSQKYFQDMADAYDAEPDLTSEIVSQSQEWAEQYFAFFERCSQCGQRVCIREDIDNGLANDFCVNCM